MTRESPECYDRKQLMYKLTINSTQNTNRLAVAKPYTDRRQNACSTQGSITLSVTPRHSPRAHSGLPQLLLDRHQLKTSLIPGNRPLFSLDALPTAAHEKLDLRPERKHILTSGDASHQSDTPRPDAEIPV